METNQKHSRLVPVCAMLSAASLLLTVMMTSTKTIAVYDGAELKVVNTISGDPRDAVRTAGITLSADDEVVCTDDPADGFGVVQVNRAFPVLISADGKAHMLRTTGGTVSSILADAGIDLAPEDAVSPAADEVLQQGSDITVRRVMVRNEEVRETIPYDSTTVSTSALRNFDLGLSNERNTAFIAPRKGDDFPRGIPRRRGIQPHQPFHRNQQTACDGSD